MAESACRQVPATFINIAGVAVFFQCGASRRRASFAEKLRRSHLPRDLFTKAIPVPQFLLQRRDGTILNGCLKINGLAI